MTTIGEISAEISLMLHGWTGVRERMTSLAADINDTTTTFNVTNGTRVTRGLIEIDEELMLVDSVDEATVLLFPDGRAEEATDAASHLANARVVNDPIFPKVSILRAMRDTVSEIHPDLYAVKKTQIAWTPARFTYELPSDVDRVLEVKYDIPGPTGYWPYATYWNYDSTANVSEYPSGKTLTIDAGIVPGFAVEVTYAAPFGVVTGSSQTFEDLSIPDSCRDVITYGAAWRLTQSLETSRLQMQSVEQMARQDAVPVGSSTKLAQQWFAMFQNFKDRERKRLLNLKPMQIHYKAGN